MIPQNGLSHQDIYFLCGIIGADSESVYVIHVYLRLRKML